MSGGEEEEEKKRKGRGSHGHPAVHIWHRCVDARWSTMAGGKKGTPGWNRKHRPSTCSSTHGWKKGETDVSGMQSRLSRLRFLQSLLVLCCWITLACCALHASYLLCCSCRAHRSSHRLTRLSPPHPHHGRHVMVLFSFPPPSASFRDPIHGVVLRSFLASCEEDGGGGRQSLSFQSERRHLLAPTGAALAWSASLAGTSPGLGHRS
jgi:hypothetical protein